MSSGCTTCTGECCRQYLVHVNGRDAVTIARGQALALEQFLDVGPEAGPEGTSFRLDDGAAAYSLNLRRRDDGGCSFLVALTDGSYRCGIYPQRPLTCAIFPLRLYRGSVDIRPDVICEPSGRRLTTVDLPRAHEMLLRAAFEWSVYAIVVASWNEFRAAAALVVNAPAYFAYLLAAYDAIDAALAEMPGAQTAERIAHWMDGAPNADTVRGRHDIEQRIAAALAPVVVNALGE